MRSPARSAVALAVATLLVSRSASPSTGGVHLDVYRGGPSPALEDSAVRVLVASPSGPVPCTGALVAPTLVLTSRHCVVQGNVSFTGIRDRCTLGSEPEPPESITVQVGQTGQRDFRVARVFLDLSADDCTHDIAALELTEPVPDVQPPPIRLDDVVPPIPGGAAAACETAPDPNSCLTHVGWGFFTVNDAGVGIVPTSRLNTRAKVLSVQGGTVIAGDGATHEIPVADYIVTDGVLCPGDSGGPAYDATGAIATICDFVDYPGGSVLTLRCDPGSLAICERLDKRKDFIERAFQAIGKMPHRQGKPPPSDIGGACTQDNECNSNFCVTVGTRSSCSRVCDASSACPAPLACTPTGKGFSVCLDAPLPPNKPATCSLRHSPTSTGRELVTIGLLGVGLLAWRRRRRARGPQWLSGASQKRIDTFSSKRTDST